MQNEFSGTAHNVIQARDIFGDVRLPTSFALPVPRQLPANVTHFVNREEQLANLDSLLGAEVDRCGVVVLSAIGGTAGVGKTALAVHWSHRVRDHFPDGDLYIDLRGYNSQPALTPDQALSALIRAFDVPPEKIPLDTHSRAALYRTLLDRRRVLIVLDNAATATQVRPLLPGSPTCVVVVTSRSRLSGLAIRNGANLVTLDLLPPDEALILLRTIIGDDRADAEPESARRLVHRCGRLPLAIRIAGERVNAHPENRLADFVAELEDEHARIDALSDEEDGDTAVRTVFSWSYKALPPPTARMFRLLGLHAVSEIGTNAAAASAGLTVPYARRLLESLTSAHLVMRVSRDRYRFHDLLRSYAAERAAQDESEEGRKRAIGRVLRWYLHGVDATDRVFAPSRRRVPLDLPPPDQQLPVFTSSSEALWWCETELANLVAVARLAAEHGFHSTAWQLAAVLGEFLFQRKHWSEMVTTHRIGLAGARSAGDRVGEGWMLTNLGLVHVETGRFEEAVQACEQGLTVLRAIGDRHCEGVALTNYGLALAGLRRFDEAVDRQRQALVVHRETGSRWGEAWALSNLGRALAGLRRFDEAVESYENAVRLHQSVDNKWAAGSTLTDLGIALGRLSRFDEAAHVLGRSTAVHDEAGNLWGKAAAHTVLGDVLQGRGRPDAARQQWFLALEIFEELDLRQASEIRARLGIPGETTRGMS